MHLLGNGRREHTVRNGDIHPPPFSGTISCMASAPGPGTGTATQHAQDSAATLCTEPGVVLEGRGVGVESLEGADDILLNLEVYCWHMQPDLIQTCLDRCILVVDRSVRVLTRARLRVAQA